ncbi:MlaC/ttg2D family ABC transporter substrate-binding protein [Nitrosococcus watsonii]|uniref:Toluene tolerance family protein n=1 Tax=Nitrosococcus watsoni (strain C-113) TaxID=105559 RepID=D8K4V7_NITWC|nr:ABC transporter substrate-binding protein [Nitrosococcus watsonii]ADJ27934.1 toluene tolerance family protein [Nitrosococcus watsonii C-113]
MKCQYRAKQFLVRWIMVAGLIVPLGVSAQAATSSPRDIVLETSQRVLEELQDKNVTPADNPEYFYRLADKLIVPHFNFRRMSQRVLGKYWRQASQQQKADFTDQFRQLLVRTYVTALHSYSAEDIQDFLQERIKVLPANYPPEATRAGVKVQVESDKGRPPINMMLNLYLDQKKNWKVDDVQVEGVSLVTNYRASFYREIRANGLQGLIDRLTARNQQVMK